MCVCLCIYIYVCLYIYVCSCICINYLARLLFPLLAFAPPRKHLVGGSKLWVEGLGLRAWG